MRRYVVEIPRDVPDGWRVVHNHVIWPGEMSLNGFRAWLQSDDDALPLVLCDCAFASDRDYEHHRVDPAFRASGGRTDYREREREGS
jgi:hypothetical protein